MSAFTMIDGWEYYVKYSDKLNSWWIMCNCKDLLTSSHEYGPYEEERDARDALKQLKE